MGARVAGRCSVWLAEMNVGTLEVLRRGRRVLPVVCVPATLDSSRGSHSRRQASRARPRLARGLLQGGHPSLGTPCRWGHALPGVLGAAKGLQSFARFALHLHLAFKACAAIVCLTLSCAQSAQPLAEALPTGGSRHLRKIALCSLEFKFCHGWRKQKSHP